MDGGGVTLSRPLEIRFDFRLTFDDGPHHIWTPQILDLLDEHNVKATFFVIGQHILGREPLLKRMVAEGHQVGNHTLSHRRLTEEDDAGVRVELKACSRLVALACGVRPAFYRAPYLDRDSRIDEIARKVYLGAEEMWPPISPNDWALDDPEEIAVRVRYALTHTQGARAGLHPTVCLHDGIPPGGGNGTSSRAPTVEAVRLLLAGA